MPYAEVVSVMAECVSGRPGRSSGAALTDELCVPGHAPYPPSVSVYVSVKPGEHPSSPSGFSEQSAN